ncbi:MAG: hypothetical protein Q8K60_01835 [Parachlamydiaceae bacterium]|nr:hypothetical protein [Parachlamydiaceae bacterium]
MCFSTEASFTAAAGLGIVGILTLKKCKSKSLYFLASIPLLFAIQQLSEGFLWLHFNQLIDSKIFFKKSISFFLIFAFLIWPIWIPLSLYLPEKIQWRRILIGLNLFCGIILAAVNLYYSLQQDINVQLINHSIQYLGNTPSQYYIYPVVVLLPFFLSSLRNAWIFGILTALAFIVAEYYYMETFVSVWCFFAAIVSLSIYKIVKDNPNIQSL